MPKIVYDRRNCEGYFICVAQAPGDFAEDDEAGEPKAKLLGEFRSLGGGLYEKEIDEDQVDDALEAAAGCPVDVIKVLDDDGRVIGGPKELPIEH